MSSIMGIDTAIGLAHWNLRGGWRRSLIVTGCFVLLILGLMISTIQLRSKYSTPQTIWAAWRIWLLLLQCGILVLFTASRVAVAIRSDVTSRMLESHKLMPIVPLTAVSGYLWGPTGQILCVAAANFLLGLFATLAAGMDVQVWLGPNLILSVFAVFTWVLGAFCGFFSRSAWAGIFGLTLVIGLSQGAIMMVLPCIGMLAGPVVGVTIFEARARSYELDWTIFVSMAAQILTGALFYYGAARKYRSDEDSALGIVPAFLLLILWTGLSAIGIIWNHEFRNPLFDGPVDWTVPLVISTAFLMLIAIIPIANAARDRRLRHYSPLIGVLGAAIILLLPVVVLSRPTATVIGFTAFTLIGSLLSVCYLLRIMYRATRQGWIIVTCWIAIAWLAPLIVDLAIWTTAHNGDDFEMGILSSVSPIGSLIMGWTRRPHVAAAGVIIQLLVATFWMVLFHGTRRQSHARTVDQAR